MRSGGVRGDRRHGTLRAACSRRVRRAAPVIASNATALPNHPEFGGCRSPCGRHRSGRCAPAGLPGRAGGRQGQRCCGHRDRHQHQQPRLLCDPRARPAVEADLRERTSRWVFETEPTAETTPPTTLGVSPVAHLGSSESPGIPASRRIWSGHPGRARSDCNHRMRLDFPAHNGETKDES